jgi:hypothetical protein
MNAIPPVFRQDPLARIANIGGPMSRSRTERIRCSLLGQDGGWIRCPSVIRVGLCFGRARPGRDGVPAARGAGLCRSGGPARVLLVPAAPLLCRADAAPSPLAVEAAEPRDVLEDALWLGLCTRLAAGPGASRAVDARPASRVALEVFEGEGFYA